MLASTLSQSTVFVFLTLFGEHFGLRDVAWDFGCPGHGKGAWDGLGGTVKSKLRVTALELPIDEIDANPRDCYGWLKNLVDRRLAQRARRQDDQENRVALARRR